jgi:hypothetical protein
VRDKPAGLHEHALRLVLAEGWRIDAAGLRYAAVGGGSSAFVHQLRSAHDRTADAEHAWVALKQTVTSMDGDPGAWAINC